MRKLSFTLLIIFSVLVLSGQTSLPADRPAQIGDIVIVIGNIIRILTPIAAVAFLAMLIYGGFQLMMSGGDPKAAAGARNTFTFAILGIILVVVVWLLLLLIGRVTGVQDITRVEIPESSQDDSESNNGDGSE